MTAAALTLSCGGDASAGDGPAPPDTTLARLAEEVVPRVEAAAGLDFVRPPRLARSSRQALASFLASELEEQLPADEAEAVTAAYARLGLVPDTLDLRALMRSLYMEQIVGYYDPAADTLFVREDVGRAKLRPVLVHELVHALQDQHMDLDSLTRARRGRNDAATAARAGLEGHATFVMMEEELRRRTGSEMDLTALPDVSALLAGVDLSRLAGAPALSGAPRLVRESLIFPYIGGLSFVQAWWRARPGRPAPLGEDVPASTEQVLHPGRFVGSGRDAPTRVAFAGDAPREWEQVHADELGEFETRLFLEAFLGDSARARTAAAGWDGDRYRLLRGPEGEEVLVWASVWDSAAEADAFRAAAVDAYRGRYAADGAAGAAGEGRRPSAEEDVGAGGGPQLVRASGRRVEVRRVTTGGRPAVLVVDGPAGPRGAPLPGAASRVEVWEAGDGGG